MLVETSVYPTATGELAVCCLTTCYYTKSAEPVNREKILKLMSIIQTTLGDFQCISVLYNYATQFYTFARDRVKTMCTNPNEK